MQPTKEGKISVSVMCSDLMNLERDIKQLERNGVDYLHVDVMDAHFVPNLTFGVDFIAAMHRVTKLPLDIHLMVEHPLPIMEAMDIRPGDRISLHVELGEQLHELGKAVRGARSAFRTGGESLHAGRGADALSRRDRMGDPDARPTRFRRSEAHRRHPRQGRCRTPLPRRTRPPRNGNFGRRVGKLRTRPPHARHGRLDLRRRDGRHLPQGE